MWRWRLRLIVAFFTALATAVVMYDSSSMGDKRQLFPWMATDDYAKVIWVCIAIIGLSVIITVVDAYVERKRLRRRESISVAVSRALFPTWHLLYSRTQGRENQRWVGVHVWLVPTWHWTVVPRRIRNLCPSRIRARLWTPAMWRAASFRLKRHQTPTDIPWRRDVGTLGLAWRDRDTRFLDLTSHWATLHTASQWAALPDVDRMGLTHYQYQRLRQKYATVIAVPIFRTDSDASDPEFLGCVVADTGAGTSGLDLNTSHTRGILETAASAVSHAVARVMNQ